MNDEQQKERLITYANKTIGQLMGERTAELYMVYYKTRPLSDIRDGLKELLEEFLGPEQSKHYSQEIDRIISDKIISP